MAGQLLPEVAEFIGSPRKMLIGSEWVDAADGATITTTNPSTGQPLTTVPAGGQVDVDRAVRAARTAFEETWRDTVPAARGAMLWRLSELLATHGEELAQLETLDVGKPISMSQAEIPGVSAIVQYFAGWPSKIEGRTRDLSIPGMDFHSYSLRQPYGVVALVTPWNYPIFEAAYKMAPALAAGNTVVLKPAELTPLSALRLAELCLEAGFPPGVVNVVTGTGASAGAALAGHDDVDKISFTGSTEVGRLIAQAATGNLKKVTLELGGKSANIIFEDADLAAAIQGSALAAFGNQGQVCVAGSRLYVHRSHFDAVVEGLAAAAKSFVFGDTLDPATTFGPLVSDGQLERVAGYVDDAVADGATIVTGGKRTGPGCAFEATVITGVDQNSRIVQEEIFGPVVTVIPFDDDDQVLAWANDSKYGLAAGVWTQRISRAHRFAKRLDAGIVWINTWHMTDSSISVGGMKQSGWGYDHGPLSVEGFTHLKGVVTQL